MNNHAGEVVGGKRCEFGAIWARFVSRLSDERIQVANRSLKNMLSVENLGGRDLRWSLGKSARQVFGSFTPALLLVFYLFGFVYPINSYSQILIAISQGPRDGTPSHDFPTYIAQNIERIETRPFDGMVINESLGRNLMNMDLKMALPAAVSTTTGAITYDASLRGLAPLKGIFKVFRYNFAKVNMFSSIVSPPFLSDEAGWHTVYASATNYAKAIRDTGLKGIWLDNESYHRPSYTGRKNPLDYWVFDDQITLATQFKPAITFQGSVSLARRRGRELMQAFLEGYPDITVIVAHGPYLGCTAWQRAMDSYAADRYLLGAFAAGMVEGTSGSGTIVDGGENYDYRTYNEFSRSRAWRKGATAQGLGRITDLNPLSKCPFMDPSLAALWERKVTIAFSTYDGQRDPTNKYKWDPITDLPMFRNTLTNALRATDQYVWHYTEWQDWWGATTEQALGPWIDAIKAARHDAEIARKAVIN